LYQVSVDAVMSSNGLAEILAAERILLVVAGAAKATILRRALLDSPCRKVPASWLQHHPRLQALGAIPDRIAVDRIGHQQSLGE
jgi:glucosamine-6-phosphate deaminase